MDPMLQDYKERKVRRMGDRYGDSTGESNSGERYGESYMEYNLYN